MNENSFGDFMYNMVVGIYQSFLDIFNFVVFGQFSERVLIAETTNERLDSIAKEFGEYESFLNKWFRAVRTHNTDEFSLEEKNTIYKLLTDKFGTTIGQYLFHYARES